jgi:hypothetical protein
MGQFQRHHLTVRACEARLAPVTALRWAVVAALVVLTCGCSVFDEHPSATSTTATTPADVTEPALRAELLEMARQDQGERTGTGLPPGTKLGPTQDYTRAKRLEELISEHGWPTFAMVGRDGASAAWLIAQHADFDVELQRRVAALIAAAVDEGQGNGTELAYLEDRIAVNSDAPQRYGTQIRCRGGVPAPATPITRPDEVDVRRAEAGLGTLAEYYDELAMMCANEAAEGSEPLD